MLQIKATPSVASTEPATDAYRSTGDTDISRINALLAEDRLGEAYPLLMRVAHQPNAGPVVLTTAALAAVKLEKPETAKTLLERAVAIIPEDYDCNYNLALVLMRLGEWPAALKRLHVLRRRHPQNTKLLNDIAVVWSQRNNTARTLGAFARALRLDPNDSQTRNNAMQYCLESQAPRQALKILSRQEARGGLSPRSQAEVHRWQQVITKRMKIAEEEVNKPAVAIEPQQQPEAIEIATSSEEVITHRESGIENARIVFFAAQQSFIGDIIYSLKEKNTVRIFSGGTLDQMRDLMAWADIAWFEWCDNFIIQATTLPKTCRIVCRLHSYEAFTDMPSKVDWRKVDLLVFVNQSVENIFRQQVSTPVNTRVVYNGVDVEKFVIPEDKQLSKRIASVGYINYKKNPALLLYCFKKIHAYDPDYSLHIAGVHQDPRIEVYFRHFLSRNPLPVHFDGWVKDMPRWFEDKGLVISTSLFESFHYSIAEGMASGVLPLIHDWYGADMLYPREYLFSDPDECLRLLKRLEQSQHDQLRKANREHIIRRFNAADKAAELSVLLRQVAGGMNAPRSTTSTAGKGV